jgi:hypothetical protein
LLSSFQGLGKVKGNQTLKVAEGAVCCEPVSAGISLLTRENTGNFSEFGLKSVVWAFKHPSIHNSLQSKFPKK